MKLNQKYADFMAEMAVTVPYLLITGTPARLGVSTTRMASITTNNGILIGKYGIYADPNTHTPASVANVKAIYDIFHPEILALRQQLKNDMDITLTGEDCAALFIHIDVEKRTKVPAPKFSPINHIEKRTHLVATVFTSNPNPPHDTEKSKPVDVAQIGRKMIIVELDEALPAQDKYVPLNSIGVTVYDIVFQLEEIGKVAYLITWYISPTGETGPVSDPLKINII